MSEGLTEEEYRRQEARRVLRERAARLAAITRHPSWEELKAEFQRKKEKHQKILLGDLLAGQAVDQRRIDFYRGFWAGASWLIANPDQAEKTLERALADANVIESLRGEAES